MGIRRHPQVCEDDVLGLRFLQRIGNMCEYSVACYPISAWFRIIALEFSAWNSRPAVATRELSLVYTLRSQMGQIWTNFKTSIDLMRKWS